MSAVQSPHRNAEGDIDSLSCAAYSSEASHIIGVGDATDFIPGEYTRTAPPGHSRMPGVPAFLR